MEAVTSEEVIANISAIPNAGVVAFFKRYFKDFPTWVPAFPKYFSSLNEISVSLSKIYEKKGDLAYEKETVDIMTNNMVSDALDSGIPQLVEIAEFILNLHCMKTIV